MKKSLYTIRYPATRLSGYPVIRLSGYPVIRLSGYPVIRLSGYPVTRLSGYPVIRLSAIRVFYHASKTRYLEKFKINISTRRIQAKFCTRKRLNTESILHI